MGSIYLYEGNNELNVQMVPITVPVANLYGRVTDIDTGQSIVGVKVTLNGLITYTNGNGEYEFAGLEPGTYIITFEKEGYETVVV